MKEIKKVHAPIIDYLEKNLNNLVSDVMAHVYELAALQTSRNGGPTFIKDANGVTVAILCYYFKRWLPLVGESAVRFELDPLERASGYQRMCTSGRKLWARAQKTAKASHDGLLEEIAKGGITNAQADAHTKEIEVVRRTFIEPKDGFGFKTREEVTEHLKKIGALPKDEEAS